MDLIHTLLSAIIIFIVGTLLKKVNWLQLVTFSDLDCNEIPNRHDHTQFKAQVSFWEVQ
jgi:hypothetical protein